ncbi:MAG TPA: DUF6795 domain-containing protein [Limnobacter sp.]|uniref:DUF6795 domain-containing protein n=1 Tax=Limnobacter sp. TaxID=2003368 RepID=UPI002EDA2140
MRLDNLILCSPIEGQLLDHGKPAPGLKIERRLKWNMEKTPRTDYAVTDAQGRFTLPEVRGGADFGWLSKYLHVPSVGIRIRLVEGDQKSDLVYFTRNSYDVSAEFGVPLIQMRCDLADRTLVDQTFPVIKCHLNNIEESSNVK